MIYMYKKTLGMTSLFQSILNQNWMLFVN